MTKHYETEYGVMSTPPPPDEVLKLRVAIEENAKKANLDLPNPVHVEKCPDGSWQLCDNYESFWSMIYMYRNGQWFVRHMFSERPERLYSFDKAMADAAIMYTA